MVLLQSTRIARARIVSITSSSGRVLHSSAGVGRGVAIGGASPSSQQSNVGGGGSPFAALRRQVKTEKDEGAVKDDVQKPETSSQARSNANRHAGILAASVPQQLASSSVQARTQAIRRDEQVDRTGHSATSGTVNGDWSTLSRKIETAQKKERAEGVARRSKRTYASGAGAGAIESLPQWSVNGTSGIQRSFAFHDQTRSRMFLHGVSSTLLLHRGWVGRVSLDRTAQGSERVIVSLAGSRDVDEAHAVSSDVSVSEQDLALAEAIDSLYGDVKTTKTQPIGKGRSLAFAEDNGSADKKSSQSSSVLETEHALPSEPIDEHVPVFVNKTEEEPTMSALGSTTSRTNVSPIEEYVPVPNLHQQPRREFATLMGRQPYTTRGSGLTSIVASKAAAETLTARLSSSSSARHRRRHTTWSLANANVQASLNAWSELVRRSQVQEVLRIDDFLPVHVDASQVGPRRTVTG